MQEVCHVQRYAVCDIVISFKAGSGLRQVPYKDEV